MEHVCVCVRINTFRYFYKLEEYLRIYSNKFPGQFSAFLRVEITYWNETREARGEGMNRWSERERSVRFSRGSHIQTSSLSTFSFLHIIRPVQYRTPRCNNFRLFELKTIRYISFLSSTPRYSLRVISPSQFRQIWSTKSGDEYLFKLSLLGAEIGEIPIRRRTLGEGKERKEDNKTR